MGYLPVVRSLSLSMKLEILRSQHTPYAFKQSQCQHDIDNPVMLYVEFLYQKSGTDPSWGGNRSDRCNQEFKPDQPTQRLTVWSDDPCQRCDSKHVDFDIYKLQQESFHERGWSLPFANFRLAYSNMYRKPKDVSSSDILHDLQSIRKKCAYSVRKKGTDDLTLILSYCKIEIYR